MLATSPRNQNVDFSEGRPAGYSHIFLAAALCSKELTTTRSRSLFTRRACGSKTAGPAGDQSCAPDFLMTHERFTWVFQ
jgi:hypothetical protein